MCNSIRVSSYVTSLFASVRWSTGIRCHSATLPFAFDILGALVLQRRLPSSSIALTGSSGWTAGRPGESTRKKTWTGDRNPISFSFHNYVTPGHNYWPGSHSGIGIRSSANTIPPERRKFSSHLANFPVNTSHRGKGKKSDTTECKIKMETTVFRFRRTFDNPGSRSDRSQVP